MGEHMEEQSVHAEGKIAVEEWLDHGGRLVPDAAHLGESLGLNDVLAVDMRRTDGIEHVVGLVVGGTVEPEFSHRQVDIFVVGHAVGNHRGGHAFCRELHAVALGAGLDGLEKDVVEQFVDGEADVAQHLFGAFHGNACIDGQIRYQVVAATAKELVGKMRRPVLTAALP